MVELAKHIEILLLNNDCVIVPGFGGFMAHHVDSVYDEEEKTYTRINANTYVFEGKTLLSDFFKILDIDDETFEEVEGDADSLAGLLLEIKGDFPVLHEKIDFKNFTFEVVELDNYRISKIKLVIHDKAAE